MLGLIGFCKTTGGKGLHVVTPISQPKKGSLDWSVAKVFAEAAVTQMAAGRQPEPLPHDDGQERSPRKDFPRLSTQRSHGDRSRGAIHTRASRRDYLDAARLDASKGWPESDALYDSHDPPSCSQRAR